jgi:SAM-dependent methyltransferase
LFWQHLRLLEWSEAKLVMMDADIKRQVREFYNQVGWQAAGEGFYQNARYEDLRPVSREYVHRCHLRVARHLRPAGRFLLDAGSGPIQYPEYLVYSSGYRGRVCVDISSVALQEARKRIGDCREGGHGMFVVADIANLPFKPGVFDGVVSLHTVHHLPRQEHPRAYRELHRVMAPGSSAVVVNGWDQPPLTVVLDELAKVVEKAYSWFKKKNPVPAGGSSPVVSHPNPSQNSTTNKAQGTFVRKSSPAALRQEIGQWMQFEIRVWRSVNVRTLRSFIHERRGGRQILRMLFWLEERFPRFFGEKGQYPMIIIHKAGTG